MNQEISTNEGIQSDFKERNGLNETLNIQKKVNFNSNLQNSSSTQLKSLENQLNNLEKVNIRLTNELNEIESKNQNTIKEISKVKEEISKTKALIIKNEEEQLQKYKEFEKLHNEFEENKKKIQNEINVADSNNASLKKELKKYESNYLNCQNNLEQKENEIKSIKSEIERYNNNENSIQLTDQHSNFSSSQISILESEITRLDERSSKTKQKINELEETLQNNEQRLQIDISNAKLKQNEIEQALLKEKEQSNILSNELNNHRKNHSSLHDKIEITYKQKFEELRNQHNLKIRQMKQEYSEASKDSNQVGEQLLSALSTIESLKSDNKALELMINSPIRNAQQGIMIDIPTNTSFASDFGFNFNAGSRKSKIKLTPLATILPGNFNPKIYEVINKYDAQSQNIAHHINSKPILRLLLLIWLVLSNILLIRLFL